MNFPAFSAPSNLYQLAEKRSICSWSVTQMFFVFLHIKILSREKVQMQKSKHQCTEASSFQKARKVGLFFFIDTMI